MSTVRHRWCTRAAGEQEAGRSTQENLRQDGKGQTVCVRTYTSQRFDEWPTSHHSNATTYSKAWIDLNCMFYSVKRVCILPPAVSLYFSSEIKARSLFGYTPKSTLEIFQTFVDTDKTQRLTLNAAGQHMEKQRLICGNIIFYKIDKRSQTCWKLQFMCDAPAG